MMPTAEIFKASGKKKRLKIILAEDDDLLDSIRQAMINNNVEKANVENAYGTIKEGEANYFLGNNYKNLKMKDTEVKSASGYFETRGQTKELFGRLSLVVMHNEKQKTVTLTEGKAKDGFTIELLFIEIQN